MSRLEQLKTMLAEEPADTFLRYGVAMEYAKAQQLPEALQEFAELLKRDPNYVAGYFMAGRTQEQAGDVAAAKQLYEQGVEAARRTGDTHAAAEIGDALAALQ